MANPTCKTYAPTHLHPYSAFFKGRLLSDGGSSCQMRFIYQRYPFIPWWKYTAWQDCNEEADIQVHCADLSYISGCAYQCMVRNADGYGFGQLYKFWLPTPTKPKEGAPWLAQVLSGAFTDTHYDFTLTTDIACDLHVLVGTRKPWISPTFHIIHGVVFHHDPELYFRWYLSVDQNEEGDVTTHTFHIAAPMENITYWLVALGTVDGLESPSISPPYSFLRTPLPIMQVNDATDITPTSAIIHGRIFDDQGTPVYARMRYTKTDTYNQFTPIIGPFPSIHNWQEPISSLDPDTTYKFSSIGSHDYSMDRYGWSYPKYFRTLEPVYTEMCHCTCRLNYAVNSEGGFLDSCPFRPSSSYDLVKFNWRLSISSGATPPAEMSFRIYNVDAIGKPIGAPLYQTTFPGPTITYPAWQLYTATFPPIPLAAGNLYAWVLGTAEDHRFVYSYNYNATCIAHGVQRWRSRYSPLDWQWPRGTLNVWFRSWTY